MNYTENEVNHLQIHPTTGHLYTRFCLVITLASMKFSLHSAFASFAFGEHFALAATIPVLSSLFNNILLTLGSDHLTLSVPNLVLQRNRALKPGRIYT